MSIGNVADLDAAAGQVDMYAQMEANANAAKRVL